MEKIYTTHNQKCDLINASSETIRFLLDFSKSLHIVEHGSMKFENNLN